MESKIRSKFWGGLVLMKNVCFKRSLSLLAAVTAAACLLCSCGSDNKDEAAQSAQKAAETVTISCAGDCTLASDESFSGNTFENVLKQNNGSYSYFFENVRDIFENDDITIVNLEGTLSKSGQRQDKTYAFRGDPDYVNILKDGSVEAVTLANNHSADYGSVSLSDTKDILKENGIEYAMDMETVHMNVRGIKVGIVGLYQLDESADKIIDAAMARMTEDDLVIVQIHWGVEKADSPEEEQVALAHRAIDLGADLVIGHHPHVLQGVEKYKGKYICYSLGNFCFGGNPNPSDTDTMIFRQTFSFKEGMAARDDNYSIIPCSITSSRSSNNYQPTPLEGEERERVEQKIIERSKKVGDGNLDLKFE